MTEELVALLFLNGRLYIGIIWMLAGIGKLVPGMPVAIPIGPPVARRQWAALPARLLATAELVLGFALVVGIGGALSALASVLLFCVFLMARLRASGRKPCGCFGAFKGSRSVHVSQLALWAAISGSLLAGPSTAAPTLLRVALSAAALVVVLGYTVLMLSSRRRQLRLHRETCPSCSNRNTLTEQPQSA